MSEAQIIDECVTLLAAGHETTAVALMWAWLLLAQHRDVARRLEAEVDDALAGQPVTFERLAELPYTESIIKETLRLYPPAFSFGRTPQEDIAFEIEPDQNRVSSEKSGFSSYFFRKGASLIISTIAMHRLPEYYPEPEAFRPERWAAGAPQPPKYAYLPFGAGPRLCIGQPFALAEATLLLAGLAQRYVLRLAPGTVVKPKPNITLTVAGGLPMTLEPR